MNIEASLHAIAQRVHALLECTSVTVSLVSPPVYSHPLLNLLMNDEEFEGCPSFNMLPPVQILVANTMRERTMQHDNNCDLRCYDMMMRSIAVVPIERPAGLLGVLVCMDAEQNGFLRGERMLLEQAIPTIACEIELLLCDAALDYVQERSKLVQEYDHATALAELPEQQTLVSLVGHDLRLPLTAIKGYAGLLRAYGTTNTAIASAQADIAPDLQRHYLDVIMEQTQHMEVLVNDLLDVSRIQHGQVALRHTWVDIVSLCRDVVQMMQDKVDQQDDGRYYIRFSPDAQTTLLWADPDRVQQVLTNLIENAVKYSPDGGLIEVTVRSYRRSSSITVRDWGLGIPHFQQTALFRLFERGTHEDQRAITGLGLGLYIARTLVEAMNGSITLSSSEGQGTSVSFTLPRSSLAETTKTQEISSEMYNSCEKLSILL